MPTKKPSPKKKVTTKKTNFDKKLQEVKKTVESEAKFVEKESKEIATWISKRWKISSWEEKLYSIFWIILLVIGLYILLNNWWWLFVSAIFIILWILFVSGYFHKSK